MPKYYISDRKNSNKKINEDIFNKPPKWIIYGAKVEALIVRKLARKLKLSDAVFLVVGSVFGSGIFLTSGVVADSLPSPGLSWVIWLAGGGLTLLGASVFSELGTMFPDSGGPYVYLREAYGKGAAFLYGWTFFWVIGGGGIAALAMGFAEYFGALSPVLSTGRTVLKLGSQSILFVGPAVALAAIAILSGLNYVGLQTGTRFQNFMAVLRIGFLLTFVGLGLAAAGSSPLPNLIPFFPPGHWPPWTAFGTAFLAVIWTYDGWYAVNCAAEEVRDPGRTIPRALVLGTLAVTALYLMANIVYSMALPVDKMRGVVRVGLLAATELFGPRASFIFTAFVAAAIFGCLSANILFCPRVAFGLARDGLFFRGLSEIHPRFGVPSKAILAQGVWAGFLCFSGTYRSLIEFVSIALILFFAATGGTVFILRRTAAGRSRPYRAWGYPVAPAFYVLANAAILVAVGLSQPLSALGCLGVILAGVPAYMFWSKRGERSFRASRA